MTGRDLAVSQQYSYNQNDDTLAGIASTVKTGIGTSSFSERVLPAISYTDEVWADRLTKVKVGNTEKTIRYENAENGALFGQYGKIVGDAVQKSEV